MDSNHKNEETRLVIGSSGNLLVENKILIILEIKEDLGIFCCLSLKKSLFLLKEKEKNNKLNEKCIKYVSRNKSLGML